MSDNLPPRLFPPRADADPEHKYTLEEARAVLARQECARQGHDLESTVVAGWAGRAARHHIRCLRCGAKFREVAPSQAETRAMGEYSIASSADDPSYDYRGPDVHTNGHSEVDDDDEWMGT